MIGDLPPALLWTTCEVAQSGPIARFSDPAQVALRWPYGFGALSEESPSAIPWRRPSVASMRKSVLVAALGSAVLTGGAITALTVLPSHSVDAQTSGTTETTVAEATQTTPTTAASGTAPTTAAPAAAAAADPTTTTTVAPSGSAATSPTAPCAVADRPLALLPPPGPPKPPPGPPKPPPPPPTSTYRTLPWAISCWNWARVGAGSPPLNPPMVITGWPVAMMIGADDCDPKAATM